MAKQKPESENSATVGETAPVAETPVVQVQQYIMPRQKTLERESGISAPMVAFYPEVRGGVCEYCGVLDGAYPSEVQYKLCPHYRGMNLRCTYCPAEKLSPDGASSSEVIRNSVFHIADHPSDPGKLVAWCNSYDCSKKHLERFKVNA